MFKLVYRGIVANLGRLILTLVSVALGVSFVSGSFILADSLRAIFNQVSEDAFAGVDANVRAEIGELSNDQAPARFDDDIIEAISAIPGVAYAEGGIFTAEQVYTVDAEGETVRPTGPPVFAASWGGPSPVSSFTLVDGEAPAWQQVALDQAQADKGGFAIGDQVTLSIPTGDPEQFELSGIIDFGEGGTGGAFFILLDLPTTQRILGADGQVDSIVVNGGDTPTGQLLADITPVLPDGLEVVSGETVEQEQKDQFGSFINAFGTALLIFAFIVLFVSIFIIYNTFAILVGQRTRQFGLLRSIGASSRQISVMVLVESMIIGAIASVIGLFGGIGVAALLKQLFSTAGGELPDGPLEIKPRTIVVVVVVGLLVTVGSALLPAFRAARVSPLEAVRDGGRKERSLRFRLISAAVVLLPGIGLLLFGMFGSIDGTTRRLVIIGIGAALSFIGASMASVLFAGPVAGVLGAPIANSRGIVGRLARDNAARNPQRTAATATALMIGLALITGVSVLASSLLASLDELLEDSIAADVFVVGARQAPQFSPLVVERMAELPEVEAVSGSLSVKAKLDGEVITIASYDTATGTRVINTDVVEGDVATLGTDGIAVLESEAKDRGLAPGDTVTIEMEDGFIGQLTIKAVFADQAAVRSPWFIDRELARTHVAADQVEEVGVVFSDSVTFEEGRAAVDEALQAFPQLESLDNSEYQEETQARVNQFQIIIYGLLVLCLIVAFIGIVNTLALSVLERIREIGLLRAVGTTRGQLKASVRWEAVIVSVFGSMLGIVMGLALGTATAVAVPGSFFSKIAIPWIQIAFFLVIGAAIGVVAAYFPARRAAKLNVLDAIAHE